MTENEKGAQGLFAIFVYVVLLPAAAAVAVNVFRAVAGL